MHGRARRLQRTQQDEDLRIFTLPPPPFFPARSSFGVLLWEVCTGTSPALMRPREFSVPQDCPAEVVDLYAQCTQVDPAARPSARSVRLPAGPSAFMVFCCRGSGLAECSRPRGAAIGMPRPVEALRARWERQSLVVRTASCCLREPRAAGAACAKKKQRLLGVRHVLPEKLAAGCTEWVTGSEQAFAPTRPPAHPPTHPPTQPHINSLLGKQHQATFECFHPRSELVERLSALAGKEEGGAVELAVDSD